MRPRRALAICTKAQTFELTSRFVESIERPRDKAQRTKWAKIPVETRQTGTMVKDEYHG